MQSVLGMPTEDWSQSPVRIDEDTVDGLGVDAVWRGRELTELDYLFKICSIDLKGILDLIKPIEPIPSLKRQCSIFLVRHARFLTLPM